MRAWGLLSLGVLVLTWLALDDITTDSATAFPLEYTMLALAGAWFAVLGVVLIRRGRVGAGGASLSAVAVGAAACWHLPQHGQPFPPIAYILYGALAWLLGLAIQLTAWPRPAAPTGDRVR